MKTRTCAWTAALLVAALAPASPASGVSPLVYVDSNDQIIGESAGGASPETVIVRFGSEFAILFPSLDGLGSATCFYYADAACETSPLVPAKSYWEGRVLPQGYYYDGQVYSVDPSTPGTSAVAGRKRCLQPQGTLTDCVSFAGGSPELRPLPAPIGSLTFTPPLRVILNPVVFQDDFALGTFTRWSSSTTP